MKKLFCLWAVFFCATILSAASPWFQILEKSENRVTVEWSGPELQWRTVQVGAQTYELPQLASLPLTATPGHPQLPLDAMTFENGGQELQVMVLDSVYEQLSAGRICPAPTMLIDGEKTGTHYAEDALFEEDRFHPSHFLAHEKALFRGRQFVRLQINPIKYNPVTGEIRLLRYLKFELTALGQSQRSSFRSALDRALDGQIAGKVGRSELLLPLRKSTSTPPPRVKLYIVDDGVYSVTGAALSELGVNLGDIAPQQIKIFNRDQQIGCQVTGAEDGAFDRDDDIRFFGQRLAGENDYYFAHTDTNIYWLQWDAGAGLRYRSVEGDEPAEFLRSLPAVLHFEQDRDYYQGDSNADIQNSHVAPGEGWVWDKAIDPGEKFRTTFDLPGYVVSQESATLMLRLRGQTIDSQPDAHHLRLFVNGSLLLDTFFDDRQELMPTLNLEGVLLRESENVLEIESVSQGNRISRFYFDWFRVTYEKNLTAADGWAYLGLQDIADKGFWVNGFSSPDVSIWDVDNLLAIRPHSSGSSWVADCIVQSAGLSAGNYSRFFINSKSVYEGTRGLAIVILHPADGRVLLKKSFDTYGSAAYSDSLVQVLDGLAEGVILMAGVRDDGANNLTPAARTALSRFGSKSIAGLQYRDSWAFIGRKGGAEPLAEVHRPAADGSAEAAATLTFAGGDATINVQFRPPAEGEFVLFESAGKSPLKMKWRPQDPLATLTAADYIIITHARFLEQAERLADYRRSSGNFSTAVIDVEDIFDHVNSGIADPAALTLFLKNAFQHWHPAPSHVLLFGDASWDPKGLLSESTNYVPSLGNPVSDALLVCFDGDDDFLPDMNIARIPVQNRAQAQAAIDKIIDYENMPSARWKKRFLFISGGLDETEQRLFHQQSVKLADDFIRINPTFGDVVFIAKDEDESGVDERSRILETINGGTLWTNFIGHAASRTWELMFNNPDIEELANKGRYPFISSMTCHTGRFAEPNQDSFGEAFLLAPQKGAIGFLGTSGWGYSYEDYLYLRQLYPKVLTDSLRCLGDIITLTKFSLWQRYGSGAHVQNLILQYNLLGDPALALGLPLEPDLALEAQDVRVNPPSPSEADSTAVIKLRLQNWGLATRDSIALSIEIEQLVTREKLVARLTAPPPHVVDSLSYTWTLRNMAGPVEIRVVLDPDDAIKETDEGNNSQAIQVTVLTSTFAQVAPPTNARIPLDAVVLKIQTPQQYFEQEARYIFEIDTTAAFNSPAVRVSPAIQVHPLLIKWRVEDLLAEQKYYWRARRQDRELDDSFLASFYASREPHFGWQQAGSSDASHNVSVNTEWGARGAELAMKQMAILIQSAWTNSVGYALIEIDNQTAVPTGRGFNMVVLHQNTGAIEKSGHFDTYADVNASAELVRFVEAIPDGRYVLAAVSDEGRSNLTEAAFQALETLGSAKIRNLGYRDMWAIIGRKGAPRGSVVEGWESAQANGAVVLKDTLSLRYSHGRLLSERIGPATAWKSLSWDVSTGDSCDLYFNILGYHKSSRDTVRLSANVKGNDLDLSFLNAADYPFIHIDARLSTRSASQTPLLQSWRARFTPAPDITIGRQLVTQSADTVLVGGSVTFYLDVYNIGLDMAKNVQVVFEQMNPSGIVRFSDMVIDSIPVDRYAPIEWRWQAGSLPGEKQISIIADPENALAELSEANNSVITSVYVHADTVKPEIRITFDDREIFEGDLVAAAPIIVATLMDNNPDLLDTTRIKVYLDGIVLSLNDADLMSLQASQEPGVQGELTIRPLLSDGDHVLEIQFTDMSQNMIKKRVSFSVESDLALREVLNYPNPLHDDTEFTFHLTRRAVVQVRIYTVAGRLIRTMAAGLLDVGFNRIYWDGRDQEGERPANGVYLYQLIAESEGETVIESSKVIIMR